MTHYYFTKKFHYPGKVDKPIEPLLNAMNALPGIITVGSCCGHGKRPVEIYFDVYDFRGLFFLTRCVDRRYWEHGPKWQIRLQVGDTLPKKYLTSKRSTRIKPIPADILETMLPTTFVLESAGWAWKWKGKDIVGKEAYAQATDLVKNMEWHLNCEAFMQGYGLDIRDFTVGRYDPKAIAEALGPPRKRR